MRVQVSRKDQGVQVAEDFPSGGHVSVGAEGSRENLLVVEFWSSGTAGVYIAAGPEQYNIAEDICVSVWREWARAPAISMVATDELPVTVTMRSEGFVLAFMAARTGVRFLSGETHVEWLGPEDG